MDTKENKQRGGAAVQHASQPQQEPRQQAQDTNAQAAAPAQEEKRTQTSAANAEAVARASAEGKQKEKRDEKGEEKQLDMHRRTFLYTFVVFLYAVVARILFFLKVEGKENIPKDRNCVMMGNHQCLLDPLSLALCTMDREIHFMGKKELFDIPVLGWAFRKVHGFPVDRGNMDMNAVRTAMGILKQGDTLGIFPEGTRSRDGHMQPLLGGASLLALRSGCPVVPVYIDGNYRLFRRIVVRVGKPIETADLRAGRINKEACDVLTHRMEDAFAHLSGGKSLRLAPDDGQKDI